MTLERIGSGKVRELYDAGPGLLLLVATDRISAYDVVLDDEIPDKGRVLTGLSLFWITQLDSIVKTHLVTSDPGRFPSEAAVVDDLAGRAMLVRRAEMLPVEFIVRGYLFGSGYKEYLEKGTVSGIRLPTGLQLASRLESPLVTPTTKAEEGHDEAITPEQAAELCPPGTYDKAAEAALAVYERAHELALDAGVVICDTKFEFGVADGELLLADEVLTPDSSRFWPAAQYRAGTDQPSFDKQYVRGYLDNTDWDRTPPAPRLPASVVAETRAKYIEAFERLTGETFAAYLDRYGASV
ncbi:MAG: phosphoribosylaminoimidazolesuccinocarboxamide synthase [Acidobacteria bacterium]|nr:MAG: phosphoribosylaminoimidazolesuccinocarboxamide synthase [Acidobacteriota bacterium]